jgi:hypothetical protein
MNDTQMRNFLIDEVLYQKFGGRIAIEEHQKIELDGKDTYGKYLDF